MKLPIGDTPMIKIFYEYNGLEKYMYAKLEYYNYTGSIKDRIAYKIINSAINSGKLKENMTIVEATSGNTGISLSALGALFNRKVIIFMPDWVSEERVKLMKAYGADVRLFSKEDGGFIRCVNEAKKLAENENYFLVNQFSNLLNYVTHYEETGKEILSQIKEKIGGFVSGVGTGGTLMGIGDRLKEINPELKVIAIEPDKMPMISKGETISNHKIEGIGDDFIPELFDNKKVDDVILIDDDDAVNMSKILAKKLGLGVGISSGANLIGAVIAGQNVNEPVVTVFADDNKKYLSTELSGKVENNDKFISNKVIIKGCEFVL